MCKYVYFCVGVNMGCYGETRTSKVHDSMQLTDTDCVCQLSKLQFESNVYSDIRVYIDGTVTRQAMYV
jgi:hypothetical protein